MTQSNISRAVQHLCLTYPVSSHEMRFRLTPALQFDLLQRGAALMFARTEKATTIQSRGAYDPLHNATS